ncbi:hypothetical protein [Sagittula salina]|uniref:Uncharacterized protein n=1 Tax=Sagittula salina TaxID=2820268 RepID=A0A940MN14_9RHOB|nr:hypothetical protein [Sagittula salina]MBP0482548.1 hypothetical protein [Sagittula salina]
MTLRAPKLMNTAIISDDAYLAAQLTSAVAERFHYLSVMDGPRLTRPDGQAEIVRRNNALAGINANDVILSGLSDDQVKAMSDKFPNGIVHLRGYADVEGLASEAVLNNECLKWGRENIGVCLLKALYEGRLIDFEDNGPTMTTTGGESKRHVVCEAGNKTSEIIAANYAYSLGASLTIIPKVNAELTEQILEQLYSSENGEQRLSLQTDLFNLCGSVEFPHGTSLTFFTKKFHLA